jgi:hypothetical protein
VLLETPSELSRSFGDGKYEPEILLTDFFFIRYLWALSRVWLFPKNQAIRCRLEIKRIFNLNEWELAITEYLCWARVYMDCLN